MKKLILFLFHFSCTCVFSQTSIFQDASGESAFKPFGSAVSLNTKAESIEASLDLFKREKATDRFRRWGINLKLASNEGLANIKGENGLLLDGTIGIYRGWKRVTPAVSSTPGSTRERFVSLNTGVDQNKFFNSASPPAELVFTKTDFAWKFEVGQFGYVGNMLYGFGASFKRQSNIGDLQPKTLRLLNYALYSDSALIYSEKKAFDISQFTGESHVFNLNADGAWLLNQALISSAGSNDPPIYAALHLRYRKAEDSKGRFSPGLGIYLGEAGNPLRVLGGFNVQFLDLFNAAATNAGTWDRTAISIVAGFKIGD